MYVCMYVCMYAVQNYQQKTFEIRLLRFNGTRTIYICSYYKSNLKISYLNINSVQNKFDEVKAMLNHCSFI